MKDLPKKSETKLKDFTIDFGIDTHSLDSLTLVYSLLGFSTIIQELNISLHPEHEVDIKIKATQPGSFKLVCQLVEYAKDILPLLPTFIADNQEYLKSLLFLFKEFLELKKLLGKEKPKSVIENGDKIIVEGNNGKIEIHSHTYNFYNANTISQSAVSKAFRSLEQDTEVKDLTIYEDKATKLLTLNRDDFHQLSETIEEVDSENGQDIIRVEMLRILKVVFDEKRMWEFIYNNNKISARIEDELFIKKITNREVKFAQGDILKVRLKIRQVYNDVAREFINDSYSIIEVLELVESKPNIQKQLLE